MKNHKELKKIIEYNSLTSSMDHLRACDSHGWTDLRFTMLSNRLTHESKYFLAINIDNKPTILYYNNLLDLKHEITEKMIKSNFVNGYDEKNNRVFLHYVNDGIFRIGNKTSKEDFKVQFEKCTLKELFERNNYNLYFDFLKPDEKHRAIQKLISELGVSLGFYVKLANNDKTSILKQNNILSTSQNIINFYDLNLNTIKIKKEKDDINNIDVLWCDRLTKKIIVAFEVELSHDYSKLFTRFSSLIDNTSYEIHFICIGNDKDYPNFKSNFTRESWRYKFDNHRINYLSINNLISILNLNRELGSIISSSVIYKKLINEKLYPVFSFI